MLSGWGGIVVDIQPGGEGQDPPHPSAKSAKRVQEESEKLTPHWPLVLRGRCLSIL
jgi:hypothetical protein